MPQMACCQSACSSRAGDRRALSVATSYEVRGASKSRLELKLLGGGQLASCAASLALPAMLLHRCGAYAHGLFRADRQADEKGPTSQPVSVRELRVSAFFGPPDRQYYLQNLLLPLQAFRRHLLADRDWSRIQYPIRP